MRLLRLLFLLPVVLHAQPGSLLSSAFPIPSSHAIVNATSIADDGSIYLSGDFTEVDNIARPGLAKLTPTGTLDLSFSPPPTPTSNLYALPTGHVMSIGLDSWTLFNPDGSPNIARLTDLPRTTVPYPQFHTPTRLYLIADNTLLAFRSSDLLPDPTFTSPITEDSPHQVVPAADSKLWLLTGSASLSFPIYNPDIHQTLLRLEENGSIDPTFTPITLLAGHSYSLESAPSDGFRLIIQWQGGWAYWPRATYRNLTADLYNASGEKIDSLAYSTPFSWPGTAIFQDPDLVIYPTLDTTRLVRRQASSQIPDPSFSIPIAAPSEPIVGPIQVITLDHLPSGKILLGGNRRFLADGTPDLSWHTPRLAKNPTITRLHRLPDGTILATGNFDLADNSSAPGILKLRSDDSPDPAFAPTFDFRFAEKILPFPDGTFLAQFSVYATDSTVGRAAPLARFTANGEFISLWPIPAAPGTATLYLGAVTDFAIQSDGTTLVATISGSDVRTIGFYQILPDGTAPLVPGSFANSNISGSLLLLHDDTYLRGNTHFAANGTLLETLPIDQLLNPLVQLPDRSVIFGRQYYSASAPTLVKWHPSTGIDSSFKAPLENQPNTRIFGITPAAHGKLILQKNTNSILLLPSGQISLEENSPLIRLHVTGQIDPTFRPPAGNIHSVLAETGGAILIAGDFTHLDGQARPGLARLADTRAIGFAEWIAAATARSGITDLAPDADPDHDGTTNFLEYATATDPSAPTPSQPTQLDSLTWMIPCNPEAPEISRRLETSNDLTTWQPARADQIRLETHHHCLTWTLLPGSPKLFSRVKIE